VAKRVFFGVALVLVAVAVAGATVAWISGDGVSVWVTIAAAVGGITFMVAVTSALKDLLGSTSTAAQQRKSHLAKLDALDKSVTALRQDSAARDATRSVQIAALWDSIDKLERGQAEIGRVQVEDVGSALGRIERVQVEDVGSALGRLERVQVEDVRKTIKAIRREQDASYRQIESHVSLMTSLGLRAPLPAMRQTWAIAPDSAAFLIQVMLEHGVRTVLEVGSGLSTVLVAKALELTEGTSFISLEQDSKYMAKTLALLRAEGLESQVDLVEAPLQEALIGESVWQWYDQSKLEGLSGIDLLIVDGPPSRSGDFARYPALPLLASKLNDGALIFLDDAKRDDESAILSRWVDEFPVVALDVPKLENGVGLLQWNS
jgi:predicted O-methyltransferase YrrM